MSYIKNEITKAFTVECEGLYFRVEMFRTDTKQAIQVGGYFAEVYLLKFPNAMAFPSEKGDNSFRQQWQYLEDFPPCAGGSDFAIEPNVIAEIEKYAKAYTAKFNGRPKLAR